MNKAEAYSMLKDIVNRMEEIREEIKELRSTAHEALQTLYSNENGAELSGAFQASDIFKHVKLDKPVRHLGKVSEIVLLKGKHTAHEAVAAQNPLGRWRLPTRPEAIAIGREGAKSRKPNRELADMLLGVDWFWASPVSACHGKWYKAPTSIPFYVATEPVDSLLSIILVREKDNETE